MGLNNARLSFFLALKAIFRNKVTFLIIVLVMSMSFVSLTLLNAVSDSFKEKVFEQIRNGAVGNIIIEPKSDEKYISGTKNIVQKIELLPEVDGVSEHLNFGASIFKDDSFVATIVKSVVPSDDASVLNIYDSMIAGEYLSDSDKDKIIIGADLTEKYSEQEVAQKRFDVDIGDNVILILSNGAEKKFRVKGIFKTNFVLNDQQVFITKKSIESIVDLEDKSSEILVKLSGVGNENNIKNSIIDLGIGEKVKVWREKSGLVEQFTGSFDIIIAIVSFVGILTAIATIYIVFYINILHRRKQMGILRAIGISKRIILGSYIIQSLFYGVFGILVGCVFVKLLSLYTLELMIGNIRPLFSLSLGVKAGAILILASLGGGILPAYKASTQNIIESIWGK
jgi:putative ABC transport system permease protein